MPSVCDFSVLDKVDKNKTIKVITNKDKILFEKYNCTVFDYSLDDEYKIMNSRLTAAALEIICRENYCILEQSTCLVTGYGYLTKEIIKMLNKYTDRVDIVARKKEIKNELQAYNIGFINLNEMTKYNFEKYSYVFNTIPSMVFTEEIIKLFSRTCMFFDLASKPGGIDYDYVKRTGIFAKLLPGLPGKYYPEESGIMLGKEIIKIISGG